MAEIAGEQWDWRLIHSRCAIEARRVLRHHHDAEEVVQEALVRIWRGRSSCRTPERPIPWCLQITRNEAFRFIGRRRAVAAGESFEDEPEDLRASFEAERTVARVDIDRALDELTSEERLLIALRYVDDWSHPEIAAALQIPEATARVRLHRAQKRLKRVIEDPA
jgi:RNA polymerase sigma-70 factor (ECF subfamily)